MTDSHQNVYGDFSDNTLRLSAEEVACRACRAASLVPDDLERLSPEEIKRVYYELQVQKIELEMQNNQLKLIQGELVTQRNRYSDLYDLAPVGYCTLTSAGLILEGNNTAANLLGVSQSDLVNKKITDFILQEDQDIYYLCQKNVKNFGELRMCELRMRGKEGMAFWAHLESKDGYNPDNMEESHLILSDISKYVTIKETLKCNENVMLAQAQKASMGELMSMIAHQWRQPLNNIALLNQDMYVKLELGKLDNNSIYYVHEKIDEILQFLSKTIDDFRNFFSPDQAREFSTVEDVLLKTLSIIRESYTTMNIAINIENNSKTVLLMHKNSLVQVFLNILGNAKQALDSKRVKSGAIAISIDETPQHVIVTICDNGGEIPEEIIDKIAAPYFTTKGVSGTGLGLYISETILETYFSGTLKWHNNDQGACFVITLNII
ncbi:MAG: ATP-binding protein [Sulfuricurvum sp.]|jgi:hypothetical protein